MKLLDKIHEYLKNNGYKDKDIEWFDSCSVNIAMEIAMYAHNTSDNVNQRHVFLYSCDLLGKYRNMVGIVENDPFCLNQDLLESVCNVPYEGVQEVCLLREVSSLTKVTIDEIEEIYTSFGLGSFFKVHIQPALLCLHHEANVDYLDYMSKVIKNSTASIIKLIEIASDIDPLRLSAFGEKEYKQLVNNAIVFKVINDKWQFLENVKKYFDLKNKK